MTKMICLLKKTINRTHSVKCRSTMKFVDDREELSGRQKICWSIISAAARSLNSQGTGPWITYLKISKFQTKKTSLSTPPGTTFVLSIFLKKGYPPPIFPQIYY